MPTMILRWVSQMHEDAMLRRQRLNAAVNCCVCCRRLTPVLTQIEASAEGQQPMPIRLYPSADCSCSMDVLFLLNS